MDKFQVIPVFVRTSSPTDLLVLTEGNFSVLFPPKVLGAQDIRLPPLTNVSDLDIDGHSRVYIHEGVLDNIILPALNNTSEFSGHSPVVTFVSVGVAPPDGFIHLPVLTNSSIMSGGSPVSTLVDVLEAPPDGFIHLPGLTNTSVLETGGSPNVAYTTVQLETSPPTEVDDDNDDMIAGGMIGGRII